MASGVIKQLLEEAPVKTPHNKYKNKRVRQLLDAYLEHGTRIAPAGTLAYTLYTVLPNPGRDLTKSWQEVEREWISLKVAMESLGEAGVLCAFLNVETHPPVTKKGKKKRPAAGDPSLEEGEDLEQDDPAPPVPGPPAPETPSTSLDPQALKPHFHAVLIHDLTDLRLKDPGFLNRYLASKDLTRHEAGTPQPLFQVGLLMRWVPGGWLEVLWSSNPTPGCPGEASFATEPWPDQFFMLHLQGLWRQADGVPYPEVLPGLDEALSSPDLSELFASLDAILDAAADPSLQSLRHDAPAAGQ